MPSLFEETQIESISQLKNCYIDCKGCELQHTREQMVMCDGPDRSDLMVVGQSPGATEEYQGKPFCGKAGQRLNDVLKLVGLPRDRIHVSNAVWCRNTDGRKNITPTADHLSACNDRLHKEIKLVNPSHIVCLGREAMHAVLGVPLTTPVGAERFKGWRSMDIKGVIRNARVSWHPAYELRATQQGNLAVNHQMANDWRDIVLEVPHLRN